MSKRRTPTWLVLILAAVGLLILFISGLWTYMSVTATPLHPDPQKISSVTQSAPLPKWTDAVQRGRQIARAHLSAKNLPGLSVAVGIGGDIVWAEGFGFADLEHRTPLTPDHLLRIGDASTVLTSAAAGLLLDQGRLKLDDEIQTYVPAFGKKKWPVTLRQVMSHTGGVATEDPDEYPLLRKHCEKPSDALQYFAKDPLVFEPGTEYRYSNYDWILMSAAVEAAASKPFLTYMQEQVFDPLGMHDTQADSPTLPIPSVATFYFPRFAENPKYGPDPISDVEFSCYSGGSVFLSTPSDMVRFGMGINNGKLLKPATVQLLQTSQRLSSGKETGYGLGWDLETVTLAGKPTRMVGHDGDSIGGMVSSLMTFPEQGIVVSVISNISFADTFTVATKIADAFTEREKSSTGK